MTHARSPGGNVLLFIVTFGVYWFIWQHNVVREIAQERKVPLRVGSWIAVVVVLHASHLALGGTFLAAAVKLFAQRDVWPPTQDVLDPLEVGRALLAVAFYLVQFEFLLRAERVIRAATSHEQLSPPPPSELIFGFNAVLAVAVLPQFMAPSLAWISAPLLLLGFALATVWVVLTQTALNQYWEAQMIRLRTQRAAPPPTFESALAPPRRL